MLTRREFLGTAAAGVAAMGLGPKLFAEKKERPIGVQLYTVRGPLQQDVSGTLQAVRKIGYTTVETFVAEYSNTKAKDLRKLITDAGLEVTSAHFGYNDFEERLDYSKELGANLAVCASIPKNITAGSADGYKRAAEQYNKWGEKAKGMGIRFSFHNHNGEFEQVGDVTGFDVLMKYTDPALVEWQMDCYWATQAGYNPVEMLNRYGKRMQSLHVKDRKPNAPTSTVPGPAAQHFIEIGQGTLDWKKILPLAEHYNLPLFVEMDTTELPPLESLQINYTNLRKLMS